MNICAVIVTYNPEKSKLFNLIKKINQCVGLVVIVDNGSDNVKILDDVSDSNVHIIRLSDNFGIAHAQNVGIKQAIKFSAKYVILFDHDSLPKQGMVNSLLQAMILLEAKGKVGAVGPRYSDARQSNPTPFIQVDGFKVRRHECNNISKHVPVSYLIASGSLISTQTLQTVGLMQEDLFIDYVDIEWGMRAAQLGYLSYGICDALMDHDLGDAPRFFRGKALPMHSPLRHYYLFRNAVALYSRSNFQTTWKLGDFYRLMLKYGFYTFFAKPRWQHFTMMTKGMWDGLRGRMGKYSGA